MKSQNTTLAIILTIIFFTFIAVFWVASTFNGFVTGQQKVETSWAQVESQYQRRFDLIPGLVNATKGILKQEQKIFGDIAEARTHYAGTTSGSEERVEATNQMETALSRLMVIIENYPQLNSNQTIQALMDELAGTENRINIARERYNESVRTWNTQVQTFPSSFVANIYGFKIKSYFQAQNGANNSVPVNLEI